MKTHKSTGEVSPSNEDVMRSLCGMLYYNEGLVTEDWGEVDCKCCLRVRHREADIIQRHVKDTYIRKREKSIWK